MSEQASTATRCPDCGGWGGGHYDHCPLRDADLFSVIASMRQQFEENNGYITRLEVLLDAHRRLLDESQAREKVRIDALELLDIASCNCLTKTPEPKYHAKDCPHRIIGEALALPSDSTALEQVKLAAKREALLEAADYADIIDGLLSPSSLRRMADELNIGD